MALTAKDYLFVLIQFVLFGAFLFEIDLIHLQLPKGLRHTGIFLGIAGLLTCGIAALQLNTNLSPFPSPKKDSDLIKNGIFSLVRHPIYGGILLGLLGLSLYYQSGYKLGIVIVLLILFYYKSSYEEERLGAVFKDYEMYKKKTKRFVPFVF